MSHFDTNKSVFVKRFTFLGLNINMDLCVLKKNITSPTGRFVGLVSDRLETVMEICLLCTKVFLSLPR